MRLTAPQLLRLAIRTTFPIALLLVPPTISVGVALELKIPAAPGEFIIKREVPYRPATRVVPQVPPFTVSTSPEPEVLGATNMLGRALTDDESALVSTGNALSAPDGFLGNNLTTAFGQGAGLRGVSAPAVSGSVGAVLGPSSTFMRSLTGIGGNLAGAVGTATRSVGPPLSAFPGVQ